MSETQSTQPYRLLILCWGYSIHARRRAQVFIDDPRFKVTVVSTHDYAFANAENVPLTAARRARASATETRNSATALIPARVRAVLRRLLNLLGLPFELRRMVRDLAILSETVRRVSPDVLLLQTLQYPSFLAYRLPRELPLAVTFWNGDLTHFATWTGLEMLAKKRLVRHGLRRANAITVNSRTAFDAAVGLGADASKVTLVRYPGVDFGLFHPRPKAEARERLRIGERRMVLCPRGLGAFFNSDIILGAAAMMVSRHPDLLLLFVSGVGGQEEWDRHLRLAERLGIGDKVRWDGQVPWEDMPWYYCAADAMVSVMTSDSCPNCMLEAMACGTPIVMSDTQQNREWVEDGVNGFLCPPRDPQALGDRIARVFDNPGDVVNAFARICLDRVRRDANSALNVERIKDLVAGLAERGRHHG